MDRRSFLATTVGAWAGWATGLFAPAKAPVPVEPLPDFVGPIPIRSDITVLPAYKPLQLGWVIYEEVGICIVNDYAVARVDVTANRTYWNRFRNWVRPIKTERLIGDKNAA